MKSLNALTAAIGGLMFWSLLGLLAHGSQWSMSWWMVTGALEVIALVTLIALQQQDRQIKELQRQVAELREQKV